MINCCSLPCAPEFCFQVPDNYLDLLPMLPDSTSYVSAQTLCADRSSNLLHAVPIKHDPYTPDSMDSPSPNAILVSGEIPDLDIDQIIDTSDSVLTLQSAHSSNIPRRIDRAVSPALLKSKLELIARDKKRETDMERQSIMKNSLSQCRLHSWPETQEQHSDKEKRKYNSDILWQRSCILTKAWIEGKDQQGYHHFDDSMNFSTCNVNSLSGELIIPRIAIINPSNIESNESSVYLHDNKYNNYLDNKSGIYSSSQTNLAYEEPLNAEKRIQETVLYALSAADEESLKQNERRYFNTKSIEDITSIDSRINELTEEICDENIHNLQDIGSNVDCENQCSEMHRSSKANSIVITNNVNLCDSRDNLKSEEIHSKEFSIKVNSTSKEECRKQERIVNIQSQIAGQEKCDGDIKTASSSVRRVVGNDLEILRCESKLEMASKNTTRSNSIKSQDISDNTGNVRLKLKAYKVTQKYKNNIVEKQSRCQRCCCVIS